MPQFHKCVWVQTCVSHSEWTQMCVATNVFEHKRVWPQCGHNRVCALTCRRVWAQTCVGTVG